MKVLTKKALLALALGLVPFTTANAGGMLSNTNQSTAFLRNPAQDAVIGIQGVYHNPAGVVFMEEGSHLSLNWQAASQKRIIKTTSVLLDRNLTDTPTTKEFSGKADSKFIPSIQYAKNKGDWSYQLNFGINGGGGKLSFDNGLGTFETAVGNIANMLRPFGGTGYSLSNYMSGEQRFYGITLGAAYKVNPHFSVYGGVRGLIGKANYHAHVEDIKVSSPMGEMSLSQYIDHSISALDAQIGATTDPQQIAILQATKQKVRSLEVYRNGMNMSSDQSGHGYAPILGFDIHYDKFNFATKYEFKTKMAMTNRSNLYRALSIPELNTYIDGTDMYEDIPALLALGAQWSLEPNLRLSLGYHHYYDKDTRKSYCYMDNNGNPVIKDSKNSDLLSHGSYEYLCGIEYDANEKLTLSIGAQKTKYGNTDAYISDISFVVDSWSLGLGARYKVKENTAVQLALFKTFYKDYTAVNPTRTDVFTRKNKVIGLGYDISFD